MELKTVLALYRRWTWLLVAALIIGLASGFAASKMQVPVYEASTKVLVTRSRPQGSTDILSMSDQQLVLTYLQLLKTRAVLEEVGTRVGVNVDPRNVRVDIIADTQIIQIKVRDSDARKAAVIADTLVEVLIESNEMLQAGRYSSYEQGLNTQIAQVQGQLNELQSQISEINQANIDQQLDAVNQQIKVLQDEIAGLEMETAGYSGYLTEADRASLAEKGAQLNQLRSLLYLYQEIQTNLTFIGKPSQGTGSNDPRVTSLQATLSLYQQLYLNLLNNLEAVKLARVQSTPTVTRIEEATAPEHPIQPIPLLYTILSGTVGLLIAAGGILLVDYLDDTLRSSQRTREVLGVPVLAEIMQIDQTDLARAAESASQASAPFLNAFGILRINVGRLLARNPLKSVLITSGSLEEGKTTVAVNLAAAFAQAGKSVALLDADFYRPVLHSRLHLDNRRGLSDILADNLDWREVAQVCNGVTVITSGHHPHASAVLLESEAMGRLLQQLQHDADFIIVDGPPLFIVDSQALSSRVGGILFVVRQATTTAAAARAMLDQMKLIGVNVLGAVVNRVPRSDTYYYYDGYHREPSKEKAKELKLH
jgi:capsular exopolysaccharide synthesis family protein